ncbi:hypothetical protein M430DRAFT_31950 [Amorphotheca resinae ATCC 22711]|uniref:Uncharacterized protein n=1 Tax=Amorphotheca resinae ATCC 22711 TaxID=857342 RepID=A0A2T3BCD7_AMORE|nr:hypothetical protein M430DRAFT_31950 [Amorphotheca resinae ATCC 22711]PSS27055.1 hypothetical protein M430DRAFT_31950 [Amorphotheca resinae ATCC 22711]
MHLSPSQEVVCSNLHVHRPDSPHAAGDHGPSSIDPAGFSPSSSLSPLRHHIALVPQRRIPSRYLTGVRTAPSSIDNACSPRRRSESAYLSTSPFIPPSRIALFKNHGATRGPNSWLP